MLKPADPEIINLKKDLYNKLAGNSNVDPKEDRKTKRLEILQYTLNFVFCGLMSSVIVTCIVYFYCGESPTELIVVNTILGSTLTTIVGVIAGTSID